MDPSRPASFPRLAARTARFTLGIPSAVRLSPDGLRALFIRSRSGTDSRGLLWGLDVTSGQERLLLDPGRLVRSAAEHLPPSEQARRERMRVATGGVTAYSTDTEHSRAVVALSGQLVVVTVATGRIDVVPTPSAVVDPRLSPDGSLVAFHSEGRVLVVPADGSAPAQQVVPTSGEPGDADVTWGLADFVHAEELGRSRGFWFAPDSASLLVARVDESNVARWHVGNPADPARPPAVQRYPAAGTTNPTTELWHVAAGTNVGSGPQATPVTWDVATFPYLVDVRWQPDRPALVTVLSRDQRHLAVYGWEPGEEPRVLVSLEDADWVDVVPGLPCWWGERLLLVHNDRTRDEYTLSAWDVAGRSNEDAIPAATAARPGPLLTGVQVRSVDATDPEALTAVVMTNRGRRRSLLLRQGEQARYLDEDPGVASAVHRGGTTVLRQESMSEATTSVTIQRAGRRHTLRSLAVQPPMQSRPTLLAREGPEDPHVALLLPREHAEGPLPVLLDPYGGPHGQRVVNAGRAFLESQWWADQGFAVLVADGPGTPGSPSWERAMSGGFADPALAAQQRAIEMASNQHPGRLDTSRVAIRGWSFGGYLAALAVLADPGTFHAAVAGAPVTDWRLYDTAYTERYLGLPGSHQDRYDHESLLGRAAGLRRPLLLIHGTQDDNVVVAHTLQLSTRLLEAGRPHQVLPLSGITHMASQETVAENLLLLQRDFLVDALGRVS